MEKKHDKDERNNSLEKVVDLIWIIYWFCLKYKKKWSVGGKVIETILWTAYGYDSQWILIDAHML